MNMLLNGSKYVRLFIQYSISVLIIGIVSRAFPSFNFLYYIVPVILLIYILLGWLFKLFKQLRFNLILLLFLFPFYCLLTSVWSIHPQMTLQRSIYLIFIDAGILSSILLFKKFLPRKNLTFLIPANVLIIIISIFSLITSIPANSWTGGSAIGFMGFAGHQNTLASALLFTLPGIFDFIDIGQESKKRNNNRLFFWLLVIANCLLILLTYSRASLFALVVGIITFLTLTKAKVILSISFSIFIVILLLYFTVLPFQNSINSVISKDGGSILGRRMILWEPSLEAAKLGGFTGSGYGVSAPNIKTPELTGSHYVNGIYISEKGNSILAVVEETGLIGLLLFLLPIFLIINNFRMNNLNFKNNTEYYILLSSLTAMLVHSQFEAWWVGVGSVQLPLFYILLFLSLFGKN
jgi:O-antigen ligase